MKVADPRWEDSLLRYAGPLAVFAGLGWPLARAVADTPYAGPGLTAFAAATSFVTVVAFSLATVTVLAVALYLPAPVFGVHRNWDRAMAVAAHASTPVFATSALLVFPTLAIISIVAVFHCFALCALGLERLLDCRESESAMYVACSCAITGVASMLLGALCSAAGVI